MNQSPSDVGGARSTSRAHACYMAMLVNACGPKLPTAVRRAWQTERIGKESTRDWTAADYSKAIKLVERGDVPRVRVQAAQAAPKPLPAPLYPDRRMDPTRNFQLAWANLYEADAARSDARTPEERTIARARYDRARLDWDLMTTRAE